MRTAHAVPGGPGEDLSQAIPGAEEGRLAAALSVSLDRLNGVRDALGAVDSDVRRLVGERLSACLGGRDPSVWVAPDELVVALDAGDGAERVAADLLAALDHPFLLAGHEVRLGASIGVARGRGHGPGAAALLHAAGVAMRRARDEGGGRVRLYEPSMGEEARRRLTLAGELLGARARGELEVHYQPQVDIWRGVVVGAEALVRWRHPRLGLLMPGVFLPLAEEDGSIVEIDRWVIGEACGQGRRWLDAGAAVETVAVNVSATTLTRTDVVATVAGALTRSGLPAARLEVEVSEQLVAARWKEAERPLSGLRALGTPLAIDDFGTGHSSLARLRRLPVDTVKLDRDFVADVGAGRRPADLAVIRAVVAMARDLGLRCVAEGVETPSQSRVLRSLRCPVVQGHLYGRPVRPADWAPPPRASLAG